MKLQEICDKIRLRILFPDILGDDFIIRALTNPIPSLIIDDSLLEGVDLVPFDAFEFSSIPELPEPFPLNYVEVPEITYEPFDAQQAMAHINF